MGQIISQEKNLSDILKDNLVFVRVLNQFPLNGVDKYYSFDDESSLIKIPDRPIFSQAINHMVHPHGQGNWECQKYAFIESCNYFEEEIYSLQYDDAMTLLEHKYGDESIAIVPEDELNDIKRENPYFSGKFVTYKRNNNLLLPLFVNDPRASELCGGLVKTDMTGYETLRSKVEEILANNMNMWKISNEHQTIEVNGALLDLNNPGIPRWLSEFRVYYTGHSGSIWDQVESLKKNSSCLVTKCETVDFTNLDEYFKSKLYSTQYLAADIHEWLIKREEILGKRLHIHDGIMHIAESCRRLGILYELSNILNKPIHWNDIKDVLKLRPKVLNTIEGEIYKNAIYYINEIDYGDEINEIIVNGKVVKLIIEWKKEMDVWKNTVLITHQF